MGDCRMFGPRLGAFKLIVGFFENSVRSSIAIFRFNRIFPQKSGTGWMRRWLNLGLWWHFFLRGPQVG